MNRQVFIHFFSLRFPCRKVSRLMHRLYSESKQEPRSEDQGTRRNIKELHYTSIKVRGSKGGKCRYLNFLSRKNRASIEEGMNGCIMTDCLSESLLQLSILCDLDFIVERSKLNLVNVNQRKVVIPCEQRFFLAWLLAFTKSFAWLVCRIVITNYAIDRPRERLRKR